MFRQNSRNKITNFCTALFYLRKRYWERLRIADASLQSDSVYFDLFKNNAGRID